MPFDIFCRSHATVSRNSDKSLISALHFAHYKKPASQRAIIFSFFLPDKYCINTKFQFCYRASDSPKCRVNNTQGDESLILELTKKAVYLRILKSIKDDKCFQSIITVLYL